MRNRNLRIGSELLRQRCCSRFRSEVELKPLRVCPRAKFIEMAAHCPNSIRVRLHFDYPPPAVVDCRMCWLLVDLNACRVVADLESTIREKFEFSRRSILKLFIDDCYLPHTEGIDVVRDNDNVRCVFFQHSPRPLLVVGTDVCLWCNSYLLANMTQEKTIVISLLVFLDWQNTKCVTYAGVA